MGLAHPWFLLAALLAPLARGRLSRLVVLLLALAAAGPTLPLGRETTAVLVDQSPSVGGAASRVAATLDAGASFYLGFASRAAPLPAAGARRTDLGPGTNPQRAIDAAVARGARRIVLVSDGLWPGRPQSPVPVYARYVPPPPHVGLERLLLPAAPRRGEVVGVGAVVVGTTSADVRLNLSAGDYRAEKELHVKPGRSVVTFRLRLLRPLALTVRLIGPNGVDEMKGRLEPLAPGSALVVGDEAAARYLSAAGWNVRRGAAADLHQFPDLLVIGNGADEWSLEQQARLRRYLQEGGAVLWTATPKGLFFGGWQRTELAEEIPLEPEPGRGAALVLVLDVSGSMAQENPSKLRQAKAGARALLDAAGPADTVGIIVFADEARWLLPPQPLTGEARRRALARLDALEAGGGTYLEPAYTAAADSLENVENEQSWIVVVSDGMIADDDQRAVIRRARRAASGTKTITLALGADADREFLKSLAAAGGGRFFDLQDAKALQETLALLGTEAFKTTELSGRFPVLPASSQIAVGVGDLPPLEVLLPARAQKWATVVLRTSSGKPVLAVGASGGGRVAALATDLSRSWKGSPQAAQLLANLARWLSNTPARPRYDWVDDRRGRSLLVYGRFDPLPVALWEGREEALEPTSPLSFRLRLPPGFDLPVRVSSGGRTVFIAEPPRPPEWPVLDGRERLADLARASGGALFEKNPPPPRRLPLDVSLYLLALALLLFLLERWREYAVG